MRLLIFSCSLNPASRSAQLARLALEDCVAEGRDAELVALEPLNLPVCDGDGSYGHPAVVTLTEKIRAAQGIILAVPVYNYDINAAAKNLVELSGEAWTGKVVGFICAAGGPGSYMSVMPFANSLMLDFRCVIAPRFVYATAQDFADEQLAEDGDLRRRLRGLTRDVAAFAQALDGLTG
ncbi:MAG TPA: NADPH-dependent FMN reductase [Opitutales bacterium]|jgi:NAD(P)H-dependent FMN reductase|nr:NADPH-dependent FMN reductase [Opitutales bacterium]